MLGKLQKFRFSQPTSQVFTMLVVLGIFSVIVAILAPRILPVFLASPALNSVIFVVFVIGVLACFWQVWQVQHAVSWINSYSTGSQRPRGMPRLLAALVVLMRGDNLPTGMSTSSAQSITDSVATRLDETREITRYLVNLLIFLGLLGTFYGLATTIPGVVNTIRSLNVDASASDGFSQVMQGLETQLGGMGTAFGSSLIGLTGSLLVGLLELFAGHGQNRFYREFEEWISHFTSVGMAEKGLDLNLDPADDTPLAQAFRGLSESLIRLEQRLSSQEAKADQTVTLFDRISELMETQQNMSSDMRNTLRSMERHLVRIQDEMATGRATSAQDLRRDISSIIAALERNMKSDH